MQSFHRQKINKKLQCMDSFCIKDSIFLQYFLEMLGVTILLISSFVILILEIKIKKRFETYLCKKSQVLSDATQINTQYSKLG